MKTILLLLVKAGMVKNMARRLPRPLRQLVRWVGVDTVEVLIMRYLL